MVVGDGEGGADAAFAHGQLGEAAPLVGETGREALDAPGRPGA